MAVMSHTAVTGAIMDRWQAVIEEHNFRLYSLIERFYARWQLALQYAPN